MPAEIVGPEFGEQLLIRTAMLPDSIPAARSTVPLLFRSLTTSARGPRLTAKSVRGAKLPLPLPRNTDRVRLRRFVATISLRPSLSRSPVATAIGSTPEDNVTVLGNTPAPLLIRTTTLLLPEF